MTRTLAHALLLSAAVAAGLAACGDDDPADPPADPGGSGGTSGAGKGGSAGKGDAGSGGEAAGSGGSAAGQAGAGGSPAGAGGAGAGGSPAGAGGAPAGAGGSPAGAGGAGAGGSPAGAGGTGGTGGTQGAAAKFFDFTINGTGFAPHTEHKLTASLIRLKDGAVIGTQSVAKVGGDKFSFSWPGVLRAGGEYAIDYYADVDSDNTCDVPPADHVWRKPIPAPSSDTTVEFAHDSQWTDQCPNFNGKPARYDLSFKATDFQPHTGGLVVVAVVRADTNDVVARKSISPVGADGVISVEWKGILENGVAYNVDYYADVTNEGKCNNPPEDHVWRKPLTAVSANAAVEVKHTSEWGNYCDSFNN